MKIKSQSIVILICLVFIVVVFEIFISVINYLFDYKSQILGLVVWLFLVPALYLELIRKFKYTIEKNAFLFAIKLYDIVLALLMSFAIYYGLYYKNEADVGFGLLLLISCMLASFILMSFMFSKKYYLRLFE